MENVDLMETQSDHGKPFEVEVEHLGNVEQRGYATLEEAEAAYNARITSKEAYDEIAIHDLEKGVTVRNQSWN